MNEIRRRTRLAVAALVALMVVACGEERPTVSDAQGGSFDLQAVGWTASGPGRVTIHDDGMTGAPSMSYSLSGSTVWRTQTWRFHTTAPTAGTVTLPFTYEGYHAWFQVTVFVRAFVTGPRGTTYVPLASQGPVNCCTAPSGGFKLTGSTTLTVGAGEVYGFEVGGSNYDSDSLLQGRFTVNEVPDVTPPTISLEVDPTTLWPPNHKMVLVARGVSASDDQTPAPSLIVRVTSNEHEDTEGDGATSPDWEVVDKGDGTFDVYVRAERSGGGTGRIYTLTATATDAAGNTATERATVVVPHDRGHP